MNFEEAFAALREYEACDRHVWRKPRKTTRSDGYGRHRVITLVYETRCTKCGLGASRPTLERLRAEVMSLAPSGLSDRN
jgi:hypothetical protein